jgi:hypothetical protein
MNRAIDDSHAIAFAAEFYQGLAYGRSVRSAYDLGVARLLGEGVADAGALAKLHERCGVDSRQVILVGARSELKAEGSTINVGGNVVGSAIGTGNTVLARDIRASGGYVD